MCFLTAGLPVLTAASALSETSGGRVVLPGLFRTTELNYCTAVAPAVCACVVGEWTLRQRPTYPPSPRCSFCLSRRCPRPDSERPVILGVGWQLVRLAILQNVNIAQRPELAGEVASERPLCFISPLRHVVVVASNALSLSAPPLPPRDLRWPLSCFSIGLLARSARERGEAD